MIAGPTLGTTGSRTESRAFHDARKEHRIRDPWHVHERQYSNALEDGASAMRQIHADYPDVTAVVCTSDTFAFGALSECRKLALKVPEYIPLPDTMIWILPFSSIPASLTMSVAGPANGPNCSTKTHRRLGTR